MARGIRLNAPTKPVFLIALLLVILGIIGVLVPAAGISGFAWLLILVGYIVLAASTILKGV